MTSTRYTISAANRITGKSRTTIAKHIRAGRLSVTRDDEGNKLIDAAELIRVYGDECKFDREERHAEANTSGQSTGDLHIEGRHFKEQLEREIAERSREREQYREQVEHLQEALKRAQEGQNLATRLLENHTQGNAGWEQAVHALEKRFANQIEELKVAANRKVMRYRQELEKERSKTFWQRLWPRP